MIALDNPRNPGVAVRNVLPPRIARVVRGLPYDVGWTCGARRLAGLLSDTGFSVRQMTAILHFPRVVAAGGGAIDNARGSRWVAVFRAAEAHERLPTRQLTGHFVAALAEPT